MSLESRVVAVAAALLFCSALFFAAGLLLGLSAGSAPSAATGNYPAVAATAEEETLLDQAFADLAGGRGRQALDTLTALYASNPGLRSLRYASALAALQGGDIPAAMAHAEASLRRDERVSDSLAVAAAVESLKPGSATWIALGDPGERGDFLLQQAIAADQANAAPRLELGMRLRSRGDNQGAAQMLESARRRLHPVDPATVLDTTLLLMRLEKLSPQELPNDLDPARSTAALFGAAYIALRRGDAERAATLLAQGRDRVPPELHRYLLGDPAFAPFRQTEGFGDLMK